jgi:thiol:disulfide interchange protein DsbD
MPPGRRPDERSIAAMNSASALRFVLATLIAACALGAAPARALEFADDHVHADLLAATDSLAPGGRAQLALRLRHAPHWHTYWVNPGDAGLPTTLRWSLPAGFAASELQWPVPQRLRVGSLANYGYEDEVLLPVGLEVPASAPPGTTVRLQAHASWLVCSDVCIPGGADLVLELPVRSAASVRPGPDAAAIQGALALVPPARALRNARAEARDTPAGTRVVLGFEPGTRSPRTLEFFPLRTGLIVPAAAQVLGQAGAGRNTLELTASEALPADVKDLEGVLVADGGPSAQPAGWAARVSFPVKRAAALATPSAAGKSPLALPSAAPAPELPVLDAASIAASIAASAAASPVVDSRLALPGSAPAGLSAGVLLLSLGGAFLGGLILNLMPCVFPVLSLKVLALAREGGVDRKHAFATGLSYTVGVTLSFVLLGALMVALRSAGAQIGWGFQLQSPVMIGALIALFFLIGMNLLGAFEVVFGQGLANTRLASVFSGNGPAGSFATGVLAAVVASPCTAPFMGAAMGVAAGQSTPVAIAIFTALGVGMAAPFLALSLVPGATRRLPRPGPWMEHLRQALAFPMFLTCVWLFWVLARQVDVDTLAAMLAALVALGGLSWALGLWQRGTRHYAWVAAAALVLAALCALPLAGGAKPPAAGPGTANAARGAGSWQPWSEKSQAEALAAGREVLVDFTAAWCITCQANERYALADDRVRARLARGPVVLLKADWTSRDESISRELARFGRSGVPLYVHYAPGGRAQVLPELLTPGIVLEALGPG